MIAEDLLIKKIHALPLDKIGQVIDFVDFLVSRASAACRAKRTAEIAAFAAEFAGTEFDLDVDLDAVGIDVLHASDPFGRRNRAIN